MKKLLYILFVLGHSALAQPYILDPSFTPYFDIRYDIQTGTGGTIVDLWENPRNGSLIMVGGFRYVAGSMQFDDHISTLRDGSQKPGYFGYIGGSRVHSYNDSIILFSSGGGRHSQIDTNGALINQAWFNNTLGTVKCASGYSPYIFSDGSLLMPNARGGLPTSCQIYSYNDTFPHQYIVKVNPQGLYDSSFKVYPNIEPRGFIPYDSNRILVFGLVRDFTHYNGRQIDGLCRIYLDGSLDTTFNSPILPTQNFNAFNVSLIDSDGSIFLTNKFLLKNDTAGKYRTLVKLKPNGDLDSSFANFSKAEYTPDPNYGEILCLAPTPDGGYILGGTFNKFQNVTKHHIVKVDQYGILEPQYFNTLGPDSSKFHSWGQPAGIANITPSAFGGYYVYGDFLKWDGQPSQPIVRIHDITTGIKNEELGMKNVELYPNPSDGIVNISELTSIKSIRIYNLQGQLVKRIKPNSSQFELPEQTGMYLIRIEDQEGNIFSQKIIRN